MHIFESFSPKPVRWMLLDKAGEQLSTGWDPVLRILEAVPQAEEPASVGFAFQSMQLLASDHMSTLPTPFLRKCLQVAALYGGQQVRLSYLCWYLASLPAWRFPTATILVERCHSHMRWAVSPILHMCCQMGLGRSS